MIRKEYYKTREDGVELYRTYSDTGHKIKRVSNGITYGDAIDVSENVEYEEVDEYIDTEESYSYEEILEVAEKSKDITRKINRLNLSNNEALSVKGLYPKWEDKIGSIIEAGFITLYDGNLWRAIQTHAALENYPPSMDTASLYEVIVEELNYNPTN